MKLGTVHIFTCINSNEVHTISLLYKIGILGSEKLT